MIKIHLKIVIIGCVFFAQAVLANLYDVDDIKDPAYFRLNSNASYVDSSGMAHVFYGGDNLFHAYQDNNSDDWVVEVIDNGDTVGKGCNNYNRCKREGAYSIS